MKGGRFHRLSSLRFIPRRNNVPRVLIHRLSLILRRQGTWLRAHSITMMDMSARVCGPLLKCNNTGGLLSRSPWRGATIASNAPIRGGYYSRGATKQRGRLFEEIRYINTLQSIATCALSQQNSGGAENKGVASSCHVISMSMVRTWK